MKLTKKELESLVYQFRIELEDVQPLIWRSIQIRGNESFWSLHVAIQDAMGWMDCHPHEFIIKSPSTLREVIIGLPDTEIVFKEAPLILPGWEVPIADYFTKKNPTSTYMYDFGDGWSHKVILEDILEAIPRKKYPKCVDGKNACPPEDVGGSIGYEEFVQAMADRSHPRHDEFKEWYGRSFVPSAFNPKDVFFDNPQIRLKSVIDFL